MKRAVKWMFTIIFGFFVKSYSLMTSEDVKKVSGGIEYMQQVDLKYFDFFKREIFIDTAYPFYKGPHSEFKGKKNIRYEIQFIAIERGNKPDRTVFYFSYIPPYMYGDEYIYNLKPYDNDSLVNIHAINYMRFGKISRDNIVTFKKKKSISLWDLRRDSTTITIDTISFLDRGSVKTKAVHDYLKNAAVFSKVHNPYMALHACPEEDVAENTIDELKVPGLLYYDKNRNEVYFHFDHSLKNDKNWVRFSHRRISSILE